MSLNLPTQPGPRPPGFIPKPAKGSGRSESKARNPAPEKPKPERKGVSPKMRSDIMERDKYACTLCGQIGTPENPLQVGHVIPLAQGGTYDESNLRAECRLCNAAGGARRRNTPKERIAPDRIVKQLAAIVGKKKK